VLSFLSEAREASVTEPAQPHHTSWQPLLLVAAAGAIKFRMVLTMRVEAAHAHQ